MPLRLPQTAIRPTRPLQLQLLTTTRLFSAEAPIKFDQTKQSNDPGGKPRDGPGGNGSNGSGGHPAKQSDTQERPSRSTGVRSDGPDGRAGEGKAAGRVHKGDKEAVDGAMQHSVKKPIPGDGNTSEGRGGDAL